MEFLFFFVWASNVHSYCSVNFIFNLATQKCNTEAISKELKLTHTDLCFAHQVTSSLYINAILSCAFVL